MTKNHRYLTNLSIAVFLLGSFYIFHKIKTLPPKDDSLYPANGKPAPIIKLENIDGQQCELGDYAGKVIIINFFTTWCAPCREEMTDLIKLGQKYASKDLVVIGIAMEKEEKKEKIRELIKEKHIDFPVWIDRRETVAESYYINSIPVTFFVDKNGYVRRHYVGMLYDPEEIFKEELEKYLNEELTTEDIAWAKTILSGKTKPANIQKNKPVENKAVIVEEKLEERISRLVKQCVCSCGCNLDLADCNCEKPGGGLQIKEYLRKLCEDPNFTDQQRLQILSSKFNCAKTDATTSIKKEKCTIPSSK